MTFALIVGVLGARGLCEERQVLAGTRITAPQPCRWCLGETEVRKGNNDGKGRGIREKLWKTQRNKGKMMEKAEGYRKKCEERPCKH